MMPDGWRHPPGALLILHGADGLRHWCDYQGYCTSHQHFLPHDPRWYLAHIEGCEVGEHSGRTCDDVAYDNVEAE